MEGTTRACHLFPPKEMLCIFYGTVLMEVRARIVLRQGIGVFVLRVDTLSDFLPGLFSIGSNNSLEVLFPPMSIKMLNSVTYVGSTASIGSANTVL